MKELDVLLERYLRTEWPASTAEEKVLFEQLLELPDPELAAYLLGHVSPPLSLAQLASRIATYRD
jgi:succinate dehydrogenase flavin-adding protein (antitoxin of CptAB toxin-antitoxin module)